MSRRGASNRRRAEPVRRGMRPLKALLPFPDALRMAIDVVRPVDRRETVGLLEAVDRVAADDVRSTMDVPSADRAAMDGYAVRARDTAEARRSGPVLMDCIEVVRAGAVPRKRVTRNQCAEIATGSNLPSGADAVVRVEDTGRDGGRVAISVPVQIGENVAARASDIRRGSVVVRAGDVLTPAKVGALAAIGKARVRVYGKPRVSILTTGDEVVPPGRRLRPGQVHDINSITIAGVVAEHGGEPVRMGRVADRFEDLRAGLAKARVRDLVVCSGGSSVGERDLVVDVLASMGDVLFHGIAVRPGRPTVLGRVDGTPVLGMPGFPTSCLSNCYVLLAPMLRRMARLPPDRPKTVDVPLAKRLDRTPGRVEFHTIRLVEGEAVPAFKESSAITSMAHADGYIEIPADVERLERGATVRVVLF